MVPDLRAIPPRCRGAGADVGGVLVSGESRTSCSYDWEAAYLRFETPNQARAKILGRLKRFGAATWSPDAGILEIFCGSGAGLEALTELGFGNLDGMDLSGDLLARYDGPARTHVADCRSLPFETASRDVVIVHGGLHHLESHDDVRAVLDEVHRVLVPGGRFCAVEPWRTPFLRFVLAVSGNPIARRCWDRLDAFQTMVDHERVTYERWLDDSTRLESTFREVFRASLFETRWGCLSFVGERRED